MRISELAAATGVSPRLLRYYEEQGLLEPERGPNGYREYADSDVVAVRHIRTLLDVGLPTAHIAGLLGCVARDGDRVMPSGCPPMVAQLQQQHDRVTDTITKLVDSRKTLEAMLDSVLASAQTENSATA